ncbi:hypothetical protein DAEQUDRAFT_770485 [Daedalea quercina L-15889]|uniref:Uncharacterized protein n=1 Tax=Daedalea quercina L-15889 TaxID=1314783 RepID=A0A165KUB2_9APHY|nr:hypothetical protein DAEQUDRAFT_770485 [Daedalea quercina L-15889]
MSTWLTSSKAPIASVTLGCIFYGFATSTFAMTVWVLKGRQKIPVYAAMLILAIVLWILSTMRACINIAEIVTAFDSVNLQTPTGPFDYLFDFSNSLFVFDQCLYYISTIIGDVVVIFRCYAVWKQWYIIAFPCLTCVGAICSFTWVIWCFAKNLPYISWVLMAFAFTLSTNLVATVLLAYRMWSVGMKTYRDVNSTYTRSPLRPILLVIIESGMVYSAMLTVALITIIHVPSVEWVVNGFMTSLISLIFNMVFVSIGITKNLQNSTMTLTRMPVTVPLSTIVYQDHTQISSTTETRPSTLKVSEFEHADAYASV